MSTRILIYNREGRILRSVSCPASMVDIQVNADDEEWMLGHADDALNYIVLDSEGVPAIVPRPTMDPGWSNLPLQANSQHVSLLLDLPDPCRVVYEGPGFRHEGEVVGGVAEFTTDVIGPHRVTVTAWPYLDWTEELDAL